MADLWLDMMVLHHLIKFLMMLLLCFCKIGRTNIQHLLEVAFVYQWKCWCAERRYRKEIITEWVRRIQDNYLLIPLCWPTREQHVAEREGIWAYLAAGGLWEIVTFMLCSHALLPFQGQDDLKHNIQSLYIIWIIAEINSALQIG